MTHELVAEAHRLSKAEQMAWARRFRHSPERLMRAFWAKVEVAPNGCWLWTGATNRKGYGVVPRNRRMWLVHRYVWHTVVGPIPDELMLLHRCDNPPCCNPDHLHLGTALDNAKDVSERHRERLQHFGRGKLSPDDVRTIRTKYGATPTAVLAQRFGITRRHAHRVGTQHKSAWSWLDA